MKTNNLTPVQWFASKSEDLRGKLALGSISPIEYYEELNNILKVALEMEKQQIIDAFKRGTINEMNGIEELNSEQYYNKTLTTKNK